MYSELDYCRRLRNLISHNPGASDNVQPSRGLIELLDKTIYKVMNPPLVGQKAIPKSKVLCAEMEDRVLPIMKTMNEKVFTHVPILQDGQVIEVFSENTIFSYLSDNEIVGIEETTTFSDLSDYLPCESHRAESFRFVSRKTLLREVANLFEKALKNDDRIGLVLVTETGKSDEKLLGIITAWDLAGL